MKTITILLLSATIATQPACTKKAASNPLALPGNATAYVAVTAGDTAIYYVNGKEYTLTNGKTPASANGIALSGSDVYVAGYEFNGTHRVAEYWKNGKAVALSDGTADATANAITIVGTDVYVAGWIAAGAMTNAALWKNGSLIQLNAAGHGGAANAICTNGTDIYVAGYDSTAGQTSACYWKNTTIVLLPDSLHYATAQSIALNGTDVYVAGWDRSPDGFSYLGPRCWKNSSSLPLSTTTPRAVATSIVVSGNTTYVAGQDNDNAVYWKNGIENLVNNGCLVNAIAVNEDDLYFAGQAAFANVNTPSALFWRNNIAFPLDNDQGTANAIIVTN
jgi:hypothetical protein